MDPDDLLTTGEAARLLGVTRQHIVDLCNAGDLPYSTVGRHRRVRRSDVEGLRSLRQRLTADQVRSLLFAHVVAGRLVLEPEATLARARANLERMLAADVRGSVRQGLTEWRALLERPLTEILSALTSPSPRSRDLRQNTPFAGLLSEEERQQVLTTARTARRAVSS